MKDAAIIKRLEKWFPGAKAYWKPIHEAFTADKKFTKVNDPGNQWEDAIWQQRQDQKRITMTENLLMPFINQVVNGIKQAHMGIQVKPNDNETDPVLAEVRQGIIRAQERYHGGQEAYNQAADDQVTGGYGAFRIITDFADPQSFQKEARFLTIDDPTRLYHGDGTNAQPDYSDVTDSAIYEPYSEARYEAEFGKKPDFLGHRETSPVWGQGKTPWVLEYFFKEEVPDLLVKCHDNKDYLLSDLKQAMKDASHAAWQSLQQVPTISLLLQTGNLTLEDLIATEDDGEQIKRPTTRCQIWWCKLAGKEVLAKEKWPGYWIPNFVVDGRKTVINGETRLEGLTRVAKDPQQAHNYAFSADMERLALMPKVKNIAALESIPANLKPYWDTANVNTVSTLYYKSLSDDGTPLPAPFRQNAIDADATFLNRSQTTAQGIKSVLGMFEASIGQRGNETAGVAINQRKQQSDLVNFDWTANLALTVRHAGRVLNELNPKILDTEQQVRMVGEDDKDKVIWVNKRAEEGGKPYYYDLRAGKYDIDVRMGPTANTKREQFIQSMETLFQGNRDLAMWLADIFINAMDIPQKEEAVARVKKALSITMPGLIEEGGEQGQQIPPQVQAQMQQMQQQLQQLNQALQQMQPENEKLKIENQSVKADKSIDAQRLQIEQYRAETDRMRAETDAGAKGQALTLKGGDLELKADKLHHDKQVDEAYVQLDAAAFQHAQDRDAADITLKARGQAHQQDKDISGHMQAGEKMRLDHEAKISQKGKPTGATGNDAGTGRKTVNP